MRAPLRCVVIGLIALFTVPTLRADEHAQKPSVSSTGEATVYVKPDEATLMFGIITVNSALEKAKEENDRLSALIIKAAKDAGVEEKHLQIDQLIVDINYRNYRQAEVEGYNARRMYSATVKDIKILDKLVDAVIKAGANQIGGIEFRSTELRKHRDQARRLAIKAAKEKAELLAGELGVGVGMPRTIAEQGVFSGYYSGIFGRYSGNMTQNAVQVMPAPAGGGGEETTSPLGQIAIRASVSVTFDLK